MEIQTAHFGTENIDETKIVTFENGLPGLEDNHRFVLLSYDDSKPICWLQSLDYSEVSLPVLDPFVVCPDYSFEIPQGDIDALEINKLNEVYILCILVIPRAISAMTINLTAPIVLKVRNSRARQIILDDRRYGVRVPVLELLRASVKGGK